MGFEPKALGTADRANIRVFFLHMHSKGLEPITLPFTLLLQGEKVPFELVLIDMNIKSSSGRHNKLLHSSFFVILASLMGYFHTFLDLKIMYR